MATPSLPPAPTVTNESTQAALNTALGGFNFASATQDTSTPPPAQGVSIFKDADGNSLIVADAAEAATPNAAGKQIFNLAELQASLPPGAPVVLQGTGVDKVKGGDAGDNVINQSNDDTVFKTAGGDDAIVSTGFGSATYKTGEGNDKVTGGSGDELIKGGVGNDTLSGSEGSDTIVGGEGDDEIDGGAGSNDLTGGDGVDTFTFGTDANGLNTVEDFTKDDILKIADRNGDGAVTEGKDTGDFYQEAKGGDLIIHLLDKNGGEDARVILKDQTDTLKEGDTDGTFTL
ncbi:MAG: calcium-binding protein [Methylococcaceae bacterium]